MTRVRMPGLLNGELLETARLRVLSGQYQLTADETSQATLTIPEDGPVVKLRDWIALYDIAGLMGVYRVTNITQTVRRHIQLTLLHGIDVLADSYWAAETEYQGKPRGYLEAALNEQTALIDGVKPWQLGACEDTETDLDEKISYSRLSDVVPKAVQEGSDYQFEYDQSHFPWTMNLVRKPTAAACEFRLLRNITSATITYNDADLCTRQILSNTSGGESRVRVYDAGAAIQNEWGVVTKTASIDTNDDLDEASWPEAEAWVAAFFAQHAAPSVQIQIEGREIYSLTGESWDRASLGRMCRVALPDYGHTFLERVVGITYPDPFGDPDRVVVSLANALPQFSETVKLLEKTAQSASRAAGGAARKADQTEAALDEHKVIYQTAINKTDREISGIASATGLQFNADGTPVVDENGEFIYSETHPENALIAQIQLQAGRYDRIIQATGISETPSQGEVSLVTQVSQTHQQLSQAAIATGLVWVNGDDTANPPVAAHYEVDPNAISSSVYRQLAGLIEQKVTASDVATQVEAYGYTTLTAARNAASAMIGADLKDDNGVITSAKIKALVEDDTSLIQLIANQVTIDASDVTISGSVTLGDVLSVYERSGIEVNGDVAATDFMLTNGEDYDSVSEIIQQLGGGINSISYDDSTGTLTWTSFDGEHDGTATFSRAASGVTVSWSGTTGTVTVLPQNQDFTITDDAQVSSFSLLKLGNSITISPYINHGQTDSGGNPTNERNSSLWNISAAAPALTGAIPSGHNAGTGVGPAPTSKSAIAPGDTVIPYVRIDGKYFYGSSITVPPATAQLLMQVVKADSQIVLAEDGTLSTVTIGKPAISTNKPINTLPNSITSVSLGQTFYPNVKVGNDYFYGNSVTVPGGGVTGKWGVTASVNSEVPTSNNTFTVTETGTSNAAAATMRLWAGNWSGNKIWVYMSSGSTSTVADRRLRCQVDASSLVQLAVDNAKDAVTPTGNWSGTTFTYGSTANSTTYTVEMDRIERNTSQSITVNGTTLSVPANVYVEDRSTAVLTDRITVPTSDFLYNPGTITPTSTQQTISLPSGKIGFAGPLTIAAASGGGDTPEETFVSNVKLYKDAGGNIEAGNQTISEATTFYPGALLSDGSLVMGSGITITPSSDSGGGGGGGGGGGDDPTPSYSYSATISRTSITINNAVDKKLYIKVSGSYVNVGTFTNSCYYTASGGPSSTTTVHYGSNYGSQAKLVRYNLANYSRDDNVIYMEVTGGSKVNSGVTLPNVYYTSTTSISNSTKVYW